MTSDTSLDEKVINVLGVHDAKKSTKNQYLRACTEETVELVTGQCKGAAKAVVDVGITTGLLYKALEVPKSSAALNEVERGELNRLREVKRELKLDIENLKRPKEMK